MFGNSAMVSRLLIGKLKNFIRMNAINECVMMTSVKVSFIIVSCLLLWRTCRLPDNSSSNNSNGKLQRLYSQKRHIRNFSFLFYLKFFTSEKPTKHCNRFSTLLCYPLDNNIFTLSTFEILCKLFSYALHASHKYCSPSK
uniref:Uncharacterized protein n=1 Tax=Glossina austeni TaxID=7395 RepID=A0A1A9VGP8_GLOAU